MTDQNNKIVTLLAGGDIGPTIEPTDQFVELISPVLKQADLRFGQCERTYTDRGVETRTRLKPSLSSVWQAAGIDVISMASNHTMDVGVEGVLDTRERFRGMGKHVIGVGKDIEDARKPAIVERNGVKIAFLAYSSVLRVGYAAEKDKGGVAPMRAHTHYALPPEQYQLGEAYQAGVPPMVITIPYEEDLQALQEDIKKAKREADVVVMSIHWGLHFVPKVICHYQPIVAHAAIDAGADLILGHHPHVLKAVEVYKGKVCFYSIGNFMTTGRNKPISDLNYWNLWWYQVDPECMPPNGRYPFPRDSRKSMLAKAVFSKKGVEKVSFLPTFINPQAQPAALSADDPKFQEILQNMEWFSDQYPHKFRVEGNEIVVDTLAAAK